MVSQSLCSPLTCIHSDEVKNTSDVKNFLDEAIRLLLLSNLMLEYFCSYFVTKWKVYILKYNNHLEEKDFCYHLKAELVFS